MAGTFPGLELEGSRGDRGSISISSSVLTCKWKEAAKHCNTLMQSSHFWHKEPRVPGVESDQTVVHLHGRSSHLKLMRWRLISLDERDCSAYFI